MKLALRLGRTVRELLAGITSAELTEWRAFDLIEPIGDDRMDLGFGIVSAQIANWAGKSLKEGAEPAKPLDYMPFAVKPKLTLAQKARAVLAKFPSNRKK